MECETVTFSAKAMLESSCTRQIYHMMKQRRIHKKVEGEAELAFSSYYFLSSILHWLIKKCIRRYVSSFSLEFFPISFVRYLNAT